VVCDAPTAWDKGPAEPPAVCVAQPDHLHPGLLQDLNKQVDVPQAFGQIEDIWLCSFQCAGVKDYLPATSILESDIANVF